MLRFPVTTLILLCALFPAPLRSSAADTAISLQVPDGFVVEQVAGPAEVRFPMFATFDDQGRLYVAESSGQDLYAELVAQTRNCRISRLEDRDGDGFFEHSHVFADGLVFPMGIAWRDERLYVPDPPDLVVFEDRNNDGRGDERKVILTGFGHTDNGSLHGLQFGPDGMLYMTMGNPDGYRLKRSDGRVIAGTNGALFRVRADGRDPEVVCHGFTNLVEVAFLPDGTIIGTDNFFQMPSGGLRDALVHLVEGGLYPLNTYEDETKFITTGELLPPVTRLPTTGISGLVRYRGKSFPSELRGNLFSAQHNTRKVQRHVFVQQDSTWISEDHDFLTTSDPDFHPSDVLEDADGSLLVIDTGAWYVQHCPTGRIQKSPSTGGIYRIRRAGAKSIKDPWGKKNHWSNIRTADLLELLRDERVAVADRAQQELVRRGDDVPIAIQLWTSWLPEYEPRMRAVWVLVERGDEDSLRVLRNMLANTKHFQGVPAIGVALARDRSAGDQLAASLIEGHSSARLATALALAHCGNNGHLTQIWELLAETSDVFLVHALTYAAAHIATTDDLRVALDHPSPRVQRAALILLDQPPHPPLEESAVVARLGATDDALRRAALDCLMRHPEWKESASRLINDLLVADSLSHEQSQTLRSLVIAFQTQPDITEDIGKVVAGRHAEVPTERRALLLDVLSESLTAEIPSGWSEAIGVALGDKDATVQMAAASAAIALDLEQYLPQLIELSKHDSIETPLRINLLRAAARHSHQLDEASVAWLLMCIRDDEQPLDQLAASEVLAQVELNDQQLESLLSAAQERPLISASVLLPLLERSAAGPAATAIVEYIDGKIVSGWRPAESDLSNIVSRLPPEQRSAGDLLLLKLRDAQESQSAQMKELLQLVQFGDAAKGREIFFGTHAACHTCHRVGQEGGSIGPDLTRVGISRSERDILESILVPSSTIAQSYESYAIQTVDGLVFTGVLSRQTPEVVVIVDSARNETRLKRDEIESMVRSTNSIMPDGFASKLGPQQLADLIAWLRSLQ